MAPHSLSILLLVLLSATIRADGDTAKDRFKNLLRAPPVIERMIFTERLPKDPRYSVPLATGLADSTNSQMYELRWQPGGTFLRQLAQESDADTYKLRGHSFASWDREFWFLDNGSVAVLFNLSDTASSVNNAVRIRRGKATQILNLGIAYIEPGTVRWDGDCFLAGGMADGRATVIRGQITAYTNDIPSELRVEYDFGLRPVRYRIAYDYAEYRPPHYPSRMRLMLFYQGREVEYEDFSILSVRTADAPLPEAHYDPTGFIEANGMKVGIQTNRNLYWRSPTGQFVQEPGSKPAQKSAFPLLSAGAVQRSYYLVLAAGIFLVGFLFWSGRTRSERKHNET